MVAANDVQGNKSKWAFQPGRLGPSPGTNFGSLVDVSAPGGGVLFGGARNYQAANYPERDILSLRSATCQLGSPPCLGALFVDDDYLRLAGTSMAAPHISGLAALLRSCNQGMSSTPPYENIDMRHILQAVGQDRGRKNSVGSGVVDAVKALAITKVPLVSLSAPTWLQVFHSSDGVVDIRGTVGEGVLSWKVFAGDGPTPKKWKAIAKGKSPVEDGPLARHSLIGASPGIKAIRLQSSHRLPSDRKPYSCAEPPVPRAASRATLGTFQEFQHVIVDRRLTRLSRDDNLSYRLKSRSASRIASEVYGDEGLLGSLVFDEANQQEWFVANAKSPYIDPDNDDHLVYTTGGSQHDMSLYFRNLSANETRLVTTASVGKRGQPSISGNRIAWEDDRSGENRIFVYDLSLMTDAAVSGISAKAPHISGDRVVWVQTEGATHPSYPSEASIRHQLVVHNVVTQQSEVVATVWEEPFSQRRLACQILADNWVVYAEMRRYDVPDGLQGTVSFWIVTAIRARNMLTGGIVHLASGILGLELEDGELLGCPSLYGSVAAWSDWQGGIRYPVTFDLTEEVPPNTIVSPYRVSFNPLSFAARVIGGSESVIWEDRRDRLWGYQIYATRDVQ